MTDPKANLTLLIFDFDGVLARPYTFPKLCYEQIPSILEDLECTGEYIMAVASFHPRAESVIEDWGLSRHFHAIRAGSNTVWPGDIYQESLRTGLTKPKQIEDMLLNELLPFASRFKQILFLDDTPINVELVKAVYCDIPHLRTQLVDTANGLTMKDLDCLSNP
jgi:hypothetical protein